MLKKIIPYLIFLSPSLCFSQDEDTIEFNKSTFSKQINEKACKCIDSIKTVNESKDSVTSRIRNCIDKQVGAYQIGLKLADLKLQELSKEKDKKKEIKIDITFNQNSKEYKDYYYEIERSLMDNCKAIKTKISSSDNYSEKSISKNYEAIKYYNLGLDEDKKENYVKSLEYYKKAVIFDPQFAFAYDNIGLCYRRLNEYDKAIEAYEQSLKIDPNGDFPLQNLAIVYQYKNNYKKSIKCYERLAKINPKNPEVFYGIGQVYSLYIKDYEKALDNLCEAYNIYIEQNSPYRSDAETLIQKVYDELKKQGKENTFNEILKKHNINTK